MTATATQHNQKKSKKSENAKQQKVIQDIGPLRLLGEIVITSQPSNRGVKNTYQEVVDALKACGLDEGVAKEFDPAQAFGRAIAKLEKNREIDLLREDEDEALFQLSKYAEKEDVEEGGKEVEYRKETRVKLNKHTGELFCKKPEVLEEAKRTLDECKVQRTTSDVNGMVKKLFEQNGDLVSVGTGDFFVPEHQRPFTDRVHAFLTKLGRKLVRFPVPAGVQNNDQTVQEAVERHFEGLVKEMDEVVEAFSLKTKPGTLQGAASRYNAVRAKLEAYKPYLMDRVEAITLALEQANARMLAKVEGLDEERKNLPPDAGVEGRDAYGCELGSQAARINAAMTGEPQTAAQIAEKCGLPAGRVSGHMGFWLRKPGSKLGGLIGKTDKGYFLKNLAAPADGRDQNQETTLETV